MDEGWLLPDDLICAGFAGCRVVMLNEGHNGLRRCPRTRRVGRDVLTAAHDAGCRCLAMEALPALPDGPRRYGARPTSRVGYLAQPEMIDLIEAAVALDWALVGYEPDPATSPPELRNTPGGDAFTNWREVTQAKFLCTALEDLPSDVGMLVWCGNAHHRKHVAAATQVLDATHSDRPPVLRALTEPWIPMGHHFNASVPAYCIDQLVSVALFEGTQPPVPVDDALREVLAAGGGTLGFERTNVPASIPARRLPPGFDAYLASTDNALA